MLRKVTIRWTNDAVTTTNVRQDDLINYLGNLPMERIVHIDIAEA